MVKSINTSKIHSNQKVNCLLTEEKKYELKKLKNPKTFIDFSQTIDDVYENLEDYHPTKKRRVLIEFGDMIADMESNKKLSPIVTELVFSGRNLKISLVFISQSYFQVTKTIRLNATYLFIMKIPNKRELQQITPNHSSDIEFKGFIKLYNHYTNVPFSFYWMTKLCHQMIYYDLGRTYYKMTVTGKIKTTDNKIEQNKSQYDLDRQTATTSALSSGSVSKYEFVTSKVVLLEKKDLL